MESAQHASLETLHGEPVHLLGVGVSGNLHGVLLDATVTQRFVNPGDEPVELAYTFPLPWGAVLLGVDVLLGEKQLTGLVVEKKQAEASYEEALSDGDAAILLERNHDHSYSLNLGNLGAGEKCSITLRYAQALRLEQGGLRLLIPTVLAPRYGHPQNDGGLLPHQVPEHDLSVEHPFTLELRLHGDLAHARVASPSHAIGVQQGNVGEEAACTVTLARDAFLDRDFILVVDQLKQRSLAIAGQVGGAPDRVALLASFCPRLPHDAPQPVAVKMLVDCSGSMGGDSIQAARRALQAIVGRLHDKDTFSLSRFGSRVEHRSRGLWKVSERTRLTARRWIGDLQADMGGTDMQEALVSTFGLANGHEADVLLVTDGEIHAIDDTIAAAQASGHRLFIVGIGSSPAETHLRRLADATGGACDFVAPGEAVESAVLRMFTRLRSPRMSDVQLQWPVGTQPSWTAPLPASLFEGDAVHAHALCETLPAGELRLLGRPAPDAPLQVLGQVRLPETAEASDAVARMAAAIRVAVLAARGSAQAHAAARELSVDYQLVTAYSNFLLVHARASDEKADGMPRLVKLRQMMAAGWGGMGRVDAMSDMPLPTMRFARSDSEIPVFSRLTPAVAEPPAFLRRMALNDRKCGHGSRAEQPCTFVAMMPRDLCQWLASHPQSRWPTTCADLRSLNVDGRCMDQDVVDWLDSLLAERGGTGRDELVVVASFLYVMADAGVWVACPSCEAKIFRSGLDRVARRAQDDASCAGAGRPVDPSLVQTMVRVLRRTQDGRWPNVFVPASSEG